MVPFRFKSYLSIGSLLYWRRLLWRSQYWPLEKIRGLQNQLLESIVSHCRIKVAYYRDRINDYPQIKSIEDLSQLPVISKETLLDHHSSFKSRDRSKYLTREIITSGTTGTPLRIAWDRDVEIMELVSQWRHFNWQGYRLGETFMDVRSRFIENESRYIWNWKCRGLEIAIEYINESNIHYWADLIRRYNPVLWRGHSFAIDQLCRYLEEAGITDIKPKGICTSAEKLLEHQKHFIEAFAGIKICESYGMKEHVALICQCPEGGYHIASEYGVVEILNQDGNPAEPGEEGRIVATGLHNRIFPLIRYDTLDTAIVSDKVCTCGRTLPLVEKITGRADDYIKDAKGKWHSGFRYGLWGAEGIRRSQIVQEEFGSLDIFLVVSSSFEIKSADLIINEYKKQLGQDMRIRVHLVDEVPYLTKPKFKFVIQKAIS